MICKDCHRPFHLMGIVDRDTWPKIADHLRDLLCLECMNGRAIGRGVRAPVIILYCGLLARADGGGGLVTPDLADLGIRTKDSWSERWPRILRTPPGPPVR